MKIFYSICSNKSNEVPLHWIAPIELSNGVVARFSVIITGNGINFRSFPFVRDSPAPCVQISFGFLSILTKRSKQYIQVIFCFDWFCLDVVCMRCSGLKRQVRKISHIIWNNLCALKILFGDKSHLFYKCKTIVYYLMIDLIISDGIFSLWRVDGAERWWWWWATMQRVVSLIFIHAGVRLSFVDKLYNFELKTQYVCLWRCKKVAPSSFCFFFFTFQVCCHWTGFSWPLFVMCFKRITFWYEPHGTRRPMPT